MGCSDKRWQDAASFVLVATPRFLLPSPKARLDCRRDAEGGPSSGSGSACPVPTPSVPLCPHMDRGRRVLGAISCGRAPHDDDGGGGGAPRVAVGAYADAAHSEIDSTAPIRRDRASGDSFS